MKKIIYIITVLVLLSLSTYATERNTNGSSSNFSDNPWTPSGDLQDGDTLNINHPITINGNIDYSTINVVIVVNDELTFGDPSFLKLGSESVIIFNTTPLTNGNNNNDKLAIGSNTYNENELELIEEGQTLTEDGVSTPVELIKFEVKIVNKSPLLSWITTSELNNDYFTIYSSFNGTDFNKLKKINGNGTTTDVNEYSFKDERFLIDNVYYQLKQTDYDGSTKTLGIISISLKTKSINGIEIPINEEILSIKYYDFNGNQVSTINLPNKYILIVFTKKNSYSKKFIQIK